LVLSGASARTRSIAGAAKKKIVGRKDMPYFRVSSELRFTKVDIDEWIREKENAP
jgi:hypothetical protein